MTILLRAATLTNFESVAQACGLDARALVADAGLPSRCLHEPDLMVPAGPVADLLELAARRAREPAFGLRMAAARRLSNLGTLGLLMRDQPTLRHALEALSTHIHRHNEAFSVAIVEDGPLVSIRAELVLDGDHGVRQATELGLGTTFRVLRIFLGERWQPRAVTFRHAAPADTSWHREVFSLLPAFRQDFNDIVCHAADLAVPNPGADPVMARYTRHLLEPDSGPRPSMTDRVRRLIVVMLPRGHCRVEVIAQHLGVDRRTIANHLAAEGTSFSALVDAMRRDLSARYLKDGARPLSDVATLLGFSELSAYSRWHRARFGVAARSLRQAGA